MDGGTFYGWVGSSGVDKFIWRYYPEPTNAFANFAIRLDSFYSKDGRQHVLVAIFTGDDLLTRREAWAPPDLTIDELKAWAIGYWRTL